MSERNMFEIAVKSKLRFPFKGSISVEDLWDLSVESLDSVFKILKTQLKQIDEESLLTAKTTHDKELELKLEIVKYIFNAKTEEEFLKIKAREVKEQKQKIMGILSAKQDASLQGKSIEELQKMLEELN